MALTKISTEGVKDDAITKAKIPANQIEASELADNAVDTNAIADQAVALSKLPHGTSSNDGKFLRANNGADPSFETVSIPAGTTINNNADNKIITGSGTANTLEAESLAQIDSGGDLWIGHAPTTHHTNRKAFFHQPTSSESCYISITSSSSSENAGIVFGDSVANDTGNYESYIAHSNTTNDLSLYTNQGGKHLRIKQGGNVEISDGDLVFASGHGIDFSATGDASGMTGELLDDYERGSWTPASVSGTVGVASNGEYVKIGRFVQLTVLLYNWSDTSNATNVVITGVPFSCNSGGQYIGQVWLRRTTTGNKNYHCTIGNTAVDKVDIVHDSNGNSMGGNLQHQDFAHSTPYTNITIQYQSF